MPSLLPQNDNEARSHLSESYVQRIALRRQVLSYAINNANYAAGGLSFNNALPTPARSNLLNQAIGSQTINSVENRIDTLLANNNQEAKVTYNNPEAQTTAGLPLNNNVTAEANTAVSSSTADLEFIRKEIEKIHNNSGKH